MFLEGSFSNYNLIFTTIHLSLYSSAPQNKHYECNLHLLVFTFIYMY